ncbi:MAG: Maf family protein [Clostridiaceae bacterium]|nr:Maf family protein [Clostridia bacterium]MDY3870210.1 Maf family protein [Clostridiaceae bacterium]
MLILASQSPRRRELLGLITRDFLVRPTGCDETLDCADPAEYALQIACRKCAAALAEAGPEDAVIAADTVVYLDGLLLGKPRDPAEAAAMLSRLSGRTHTVCTGVAVAFRGGTRNLCQQTRVTFYDLSRGLIDWYVSTGEPMDKAGAYGIQGRGALLVRDIAGDYSNVVGLPVAALYRLLVEMGVPLEKEAAR